MTPRIRQPLEEQQLRREMDGDRRVEPGTLERLPRRLQQQPLLRVHGQRLTGRDTEEVGVEPTGPVQEPALTGIRVSDRVGVGIVEVLGPVPVHRKRRHTVTALGDQPPQLLRRPDTARITTGHAHNRDRLAALALGLVQAAAQVADLDG